jgi:hypothetical protein
MSFLNTLFDVIIPVILIAVALTFVFADWFGWRWLEHLIVGAGTGVLVAINFNRVLGTGRQALAGNFLLFIPIILGLLLYFRFVPSLKWLERYGFLWIFAGGAGVVIGGVLQGQIMPQVIEAIKIIQPTPFDTFNKIVMLIIFVTTFTYFIQTREHTGILGISARTGRIFLMFGFGLSFATLLQTYYGVLLERVQWLLFSILGK